MRMRHYLAATCVLLTLTTAGCAAPQAGQANQGRGQEPSAAAGAKHLFAAIRGDPRTLNNAIDSATGGSTVGGVPEIEQLLNGGLAVMDAEGILRPQLAEAVPSLENGLWQVFPDGQMETTWRLKPNVRWHDGVPVVAEDLLFTATVAQDRQLAMAQDQAYQFVASIDAVDGHTILVKWKSPYIQADALMSQARGSRVLPMPRHLLEQTYLEDKTAFVESPQWTQRYVGTGAYRLGDWVLGSHLLLHANDQYVFGRPKIDVIEVKFLLDTNVIVANVLSGGVHLTLGKGLTVEQAILAKKEWKGGQVIGSLENTTALHPQRINPSPPALNNVLFRRALIQVIDRQEIVDAFLEGFVPVAHSTFSPDEPEYTHIQGSIARYQYDPRGAIQLIEGLGYPRGPDGMFVDAASQKLSIEVRTRTHPLREKLQQVIAEQWALIGIVGEPVAVPEQRVSDRQYQASYPGFYFRFGGPEVTSLHSPLVPDPNNTRGNSVTLYPNAELDALIDRYLVTIPLPERLDTLAQIVNRSTSLLLPIPLFHEPSAVLASNQLINVGRKGSAGQAWNAHEWDLRN
jgi:peptide/nickel transport system substrate-binding protein